MNHATDRDPANLITTDTIRAFRAEAASAGDDDAVAVCDEALDRTDRMMAARGRVTAMIADARAADDT